MRALLLRLLPVVFLVGCPEGPTGPVSGTECERIGQQCRLPDGPVGVCNDTGRSDCDEPPCLACMPQH